MKVAERQSLRFKLIPIGDRIIARVIEEDEMTEGGIYLPEESRSKSQRAEVLYVGEGRTLESGQVLPLRVKPGDQVIFSRYAGTEIALNLHGSDRLIILYERDVLAVLKPGEDDGRS